MAQETFLRLPRRGKASDSPEHERARPTVTASILRKDALKLAPRRDAPPGEDDYASVYCVENGMPYQMSFEGTPENTALAKPPVGTMRGVG